MILQSIYDFWCFYFGEAATWISSIVGLFYAGYCFRKHVEVAGGWKAWRNNYFGLEEHK